MDTEIIKFGNSTLEYCDFNNINILCYEPHTCETIYFNNTVFEDADVQKEFKMCTKEEINKIISNNKNKKSLNQNDNKLVSPLIIIIGCVAILFFGIIITTMFVKKTKIKKHNQSYFNLDDELVTEKVINNSQSNNNNSINIDDGINKNNNNNYFTNNDSFILSKLSKNKNIMVNLNDVFQEIYQEESYSSNSLSF